MLDGVEVDVVAQDVPLDGLDERRAAAFEPLEEVRAAEAHQPLARVGEVAQRLGLLRRRGPRRIPRDVVPQAVAGQVQRVNRLLDGCGEEPRVLVGRVRRLDGVGDGARRAIREVGARAVREGQVSAVGDRVLPRVVVADEAAGAPHEVEPHQVAPVVRIVALLEGGEGAHGALVPLLELHLAQQAEHALRADAEVLVLRHEEPQLRREVEVRLVVRRRGEEDALALVRRDVLLNRLVPFALAVPQVLALVDQHDREAAQFRQVRRDRCERLDARGGDVAIDVILPHRDEVLRADDERALVLVLVEHPRERRRHQRLAEADDVADQHAVPFLDVVRGDLHGGFLVLEEHPVEVGWDAELREARPRLPRQVVRHFQVDVVRRRVLGPRPTLVDNRRQFLRDVEAEPVAPAVVEPALEFLAGVVVEHIDVQFALLRQAREGEVAAAEEPRGWIVRVRAVGQIELRVQWIAEKQFDDDLFGPELRAQAAQAGLVRVRRRAERQLLAELGGDAGFEAAGGLVVHLRLVGQQAQRVAQLVLRDALHPDEQAAARAVAARPSIDDRINAPPPTQIEVADAEICALGDRERTAQRREQPLVDVVKDSRHAAFPRTFRPSIVERITKWDSSTPAIARRGTARQFIGLVVLEFLTPRLFGMTKLTMVGTESAREAFLFGGTLPSGCP